MSDTVKCDGCGKHGRRRIGKMAPADWFFLEAADELEPSNIIIVYACSEDCKKSLWKQGPGKLDLTEGL